MGRYRLYVNASSSVEYLAVDRGLRRHLPLLQSEARLSADRVEHAVILEHQQQGLLVLLWI